MGERNINLATDEAYLLADIAASLRKISGRPVAVFSDTLAAFPEDLIPAKEPEPEPPTKTVTETVKPKPVRKTGKTRGKTKPKTGEGGA